MLTRYNTADIEGHRPGLENIKRDLGSLPVRPVDFECHIPYAALTPGVRGIGSYCDLITFEYDKREEPPVSGTPGSYSEIGRPEYRLIVNRLRTGRDIRKNCEDREVRDCTGQTTHASYT